MEMKAVERPLDLLPSRQAVGAGLLAAVVLYAVARSNYLLFHSLAEGFGIVVAALIYVVGSRSFRYSGNGLLLFLSDVFLFVAIIDLFHTMTYQGMGIFPGYGPNTPTQLWIAERYLLAVSLCLTPLFVRLSYPRALVFWSYAAVTAALLASILWFQVFPDCYVVGEGLTPFKVASEYVVSLLVLGAIFQLNRGRSHLDPSLYLLVLAAMVSTILTGLTFTLYTDVYGVANFLGHLLEVGTYYLVYVAVASRGIDAPYREVVELNWGLERRVAERTAQLEAANRDLEREIAERKKAEQFRKEYVSLISHDLRNPLTAVKGHADLLCRLLSRQGLQREVTSAEAIVKSARRMNSMIQDLVESVRLEAGQLELRKEPTDPRHLILDIAERMGPMEDRARLRLDCPEDVPMVSMDPERIERVIANLVGNALKYSPQDSPVLVRLEGQSGQIRILVSDQGIGIPREDLPHLFDRFYRARTGRKTEGLGLGLYISKMIVEAHGGHIEVESEEGQGSCFALSLPVGEQDRMDENRRQ